MGVELALLDENLGGSCGLSRAAADSASSASTRGLALAEESLATE